MQVARRWFILAGILLGLCISAILTIIFQPIGSVMHVFVTEQTTKIPLFYMNLSRSTTRRRHMEETFGHWGNLSRIDAIDGSNMSQLESNVEFGRLTPEEYVKKAGASSIGEIAVCATAFRALETSYNRGDSTMLLLEDDMSDLLVPLWRYSLDKVVQAADESHPDWDVIQLQAVAYGRQREVFQSWKSDPTNPFVERQPSSLIWGGGAELFSRRGMEKLVTFMRSPTGKFDCLPVVHSEPNFVCVADYVYWKLPQPWKALLRMPPMFTYQLNEGSTRVRGKAKSTKDSKENDKFVGHYHSIFDSLQSNLESMAAQQASRDFGDKSLHHGELRYMQVNAMMLDALNNNTAAVL